MAINFLSSAAVNIHGPNIGSQSMNGFCSFNGFMIQVFVVQSKMTFPRKPNAMLTQDSRLLGPYDRCVHVFYSSKPQYSVELGSETQSCHLGHTMDFISAVGYDWS